jgi:hypothetical protein
MSDQPTFKGVPLGQPETYPTDADPAQAGPRYHFLSREAAENMTSHRPPDRWEQTTSGEWVPIWVCGKGPA